MAKMKVGCFGLIRAFWKLKRYILPLADLAKRIDLAGDIGRKMRVDVKGVNNRLWLGLLVCDLKDGQNVDFTEKGGGKYCDITISNSVT